MSHGQPIEILTDSEMQSRPSPAWIVDGWIPERSLAVIYGPPGAGKGFVVLDLAYSMATGREWHGCEVRRGPVLYLAAERSGSLGARIRAWKAHHGVENDVLVYYIAKRVSLFEPQGAQAVIEALRDIYNAPQLIIVDTLAKTILPADENKTAEMGQYLLNIQRIREEVDCAVALIHHTNASGERERGNTSLIGDADVMMSVKQDDGVVKVRCEKMNDADEPEPLRLQIVSSADSAVCINSQRGVGVNAEELTSNESQALKSLQRDFLSAIAPATKWQEASGLAPSSFYRAQKSLVERGYVGCDKPGRRGAQYSVTPKGARALTPSTPTHSQRSNGSNPKSLPTTGGAYRKPPDGSDGVGSQPYRYELLERQAIQAEEVA